MSWLVTGGAGYIGAHVVRALTAGGESVVVYDDLSTGSADRVPQGVPFIRGSVLDRELLEQSIRDKAVTGVVHIAAKKQVGESVERPLHYYRENVTGLQTLLEAMTAAGAGKLVFSSSAAVYGMPDVDLVTEDTPCAPVSPYGETKLVGEWLIKAAANAHGLRAASLRYFNVAGAASPELADTGVFNLIPMVFERLEEGRAPRIFGADYPTPDGTCVRDYIHVEDIASAHLAAARRLADVPEGTALTLNIGRGEGSSVREMVDRILKVTGHEQMQPEITDRRPGDPARVVASADRIRQELNWTARHGLDEMIESAWRGWRHRHQ
ncbi:UDP-glucose 4-epimerase GalE [Streptomyces thermocarboxydovorans]|uniref:UDP-glucose 4-epimerase n=1 Tax=Streptomyces thermocarboxydovorans TaxID=59298 RepID=A0ABN1HKB0_9ACTN